MSEEIVRLANLDEYHQGEGPLDGSIEHWMQRAEAAEAKLAAVRAWAAEKNVERPGATWIREVLAILDSGGNDGE